MSSYRMERTSLRHCRAFHWPPCMQTISTSADASRSRTTCCCRVTRQQPPSVSSEPGRATPLVTFLATRARASSGGFAGPLYMLQVYDRVLASHSIPTLIALTVLLCGAFALQGAIDLIRNRVVTRS